MRPRPRTLVGLASLAFVSLGLPDGLLGVAWPSMRTSFGVPLDALGALLASYAAGYVAASIAGGRLLARLGLGMLLAASCWATATSLLGYALSPGWWMVVAFGLVAGLGAGGIDTGINTWAAARHGPGILNWLHACWGFGAAGGPAIMTGVLATASPWQRGYALVGTAQLMLAGAFLATRDAWSSDPSAPASPADPVAPLRATLRLPAAWLGALTFVAYAGLELAVGTWAYSVLTESRDVAVTTAGPSVAGYWAGLTAGRLLGAIVLRTRPVAIVLRMTTLLLTASLALFAAHWSTATDVAALLLAGTAAGPIFPSLIATTPARMGTRHAANTIGMQIAAAALGQTVGPTLLGAIGRRHGLDALALTLPALAIVVALLVARLSGRPPHRPY